MSVSQGGKVGFEQATDGIQFYVFANLAMTSLAISVLTDVAMLLIMIVRRPGETQTVVGSQPEAVTPPPGTVAT